MVTDNLSIYAAANWEATERSAEPWSMPSSLCFKLSQPWLQLLFSAHACYVAIIIMLHGDNLYSMSCPHVQYKFLQGVVTYVLSIEVFATRIKIFDLQKSVWLLVHSLLKFFDHLIFTGKRSNCSHTFMILWFLQFRGYLGATVKARMQERGSERGMECRTKHGTEHGTEIRCKVHHDERARVHCEAHMVTGATAKSTC